MPKHEHIGKVYEGEVYRVLLHLRKGRPPLAILERDGKRAGLAEAIAGVLDVPAGAVNAVLNDVGAEYILENARKIWDYGHITRDNAKDMPTILYHARAIRDYLARIYGRDYTRLRPHVMADYFVRDIAHHIYGLIYPGKYFKIHQLDKDCGMWYNRLADTKSKGGAK